MELNTIYTGDTLETLKTFPDECIDISVLSPPYNKMGVAGKLVSEVKYQNSIDIKPEYQYQREQIDVLNELHRVTKPFGHIFYNHKLRWLSGTMLHPMIWLTETKWCMRQEIIWDRIIAANIRGWRFWQTDERIYWMQKGIIKGAKLESKHAKMTSIWRIHPEQKFKEHPAPFPIELPTRCIYSVADLTNDLTILDPYSGAGSTLVAAKVMGHNYIGIDCSHEYVDIANSRLTQLDNKTSPCSDAERVCMEMNLHNVKKSYAERKQSQRK